MPLYGRCMALDLEGNIIYPLNFNNIEVTEIKNQYSDVDDRIYKYWKDRFIKIWKNLSKPIVYTIGTFTFSLEFNKVIFEEVVEDDEIVLGMRVFSWLDVGADGGRSGQKLNSFVTYKHSFIIDMSHEYNKVIEDYITKCKDDLLDIIKEQYSYFVFEDCGKFI